MASSDFVIPLNDGIPRGLSIAYYVLCGLGGVIAFSSFIVQFTKPANYGKFDGKTEDDHKKATAEEKLVQNTNSNDVVEEGCRIPQRVAHIMSDFPPGVILFTVLFFTAFNSGVKRSDPSYVMLACWLAHYIHRGLITPLTMRYSAATVDLGICLGGFFPNCIFSSAIALHISVINYSYDTSSSPSSLPEKKNYFADARFIIGIILFATGYAMNRWSDWHLRSLREENLSIGQDGKEVRKYVLPTTGLFKLCFCPNYFGEFVEWCGFAILTSSLAGVIWAIFGLSTFLPRSLVTKKWYLAKFPGEADENKAALIPFLV